MRIQSASAVRAAELHPLDCHKVNASDPAKWRCPVDWHADLDGVWQLEQLQHLANTILAGSPALQVTLDATDPTCIYFSILLAGTKIGEAYVNRGSAGPVFSVYSGSDHAEYHGASTTEVLSHLLASPGSWKPA